MIKKGAEINAKNKYEQTALILAVKHDHHALVEELPKNEANPNIEDSNSNTLLHLEVRSDSKIAIALLKKGADILKTNNEGYSALFTALINGNI